MGHAFSALSVYEDAERDPAQFILRIEDIDPERCKPEFEQAIFEDLAWLGLEWRTPVRRQSEHFDDYRAALQTLDDMGLLYPCFCSRREIRKEIKRSAHAPHGPEGPLYPGTCRALSKQAQEEKIAAGLPYALRINMDKACARLHTSLTWHDKIAGEQTAQPDILGDAVIARKDIPAGYHLCVTLDDHVQGIDIVTRGEDLLYATNIHRLLQELLGLNVPEYHHHRLILDENGKRFAKRDQSVTLRHLKDEAGKTPEDIRAMIGI